MIADVIDERKRDHIWANSHPRAFPENPVKINQATSLELDERTAQRGRYIESDTFTPTGKLLGYGCWGIIDEYKDPADQRWAIKPFRPDRIAQAQMLERKLTEEQVMRKEAIPLAAAQFNVVPRIIERDKQGQLYLGMPVYKERLSDKMKRGMSREESIKVFGNITKAMHYLHSVLNRAHGDIKPDNILLDDHGGAFVTDLGSSTCISVRNTNPRDNIGDENYRAFEKYKEGSEPDKASDIWSANALFYELLTGEKIKQGLDINKPVEKQDWERNLKRKLRKAPREFRKFLEQGLSYESYNRPYSGRELESRFERIVKRDSLATRVTEHLRKWTPIALGVAGMISVAAYNISTYEPQKLEVPKIQNFIRGELYSPANGTNEKEMNLISEKILDLTGPIPQDGSPYGKYAKLSTENRNVAYMAKCFRMAQDALRTYSLTDHQEENFWKWNGAEEGKARRGMGGEYWSTLSSSIEYGLNEASIPGVGVDLEDSLVLARLGSGTLKTAKKLSNSQDYSVYRDAKYAGGEPVIDPDERKLLDTWLYYIQGDPDSIAMASRRQ